MLADHAEGMMAALSERAGSIVSSAYEAALDPAGWTAVLAELGRVFRSHFVDLFARNDDFSSYGGLCHGLDERDYQDVFLDTWVKRNAWGRKQPAKQPGEVISTRQMVSPADLRRDVMYGEYLGPRGLHEGMRLTLTARRGWVQDISLLRSWNDGAFEPEELALASDLVPHLQRACLIARRLTDAGLGLPAQLERLESSSHAAIILDGNGLVHHVNEAASLLLRRQDALTIHRSRLRFAKPEAERRVAAFLHGAARPGAVGAPTTLTLAQPHGPALRVSLLPLGRPPAWLALRSAGVLVLIDRMGETAKAAAGRLAARFGLTAAEADLARRVAAGDSLTQIAADTQRSVNTLRTHLARIMTKTQTRRQGELVSLLLAAEPGLGERPPLSLTPPCQGSAGPRGRAPP